MPCYIIKPSEKMGRVRKTPNPYYNTFYVASSKNTGMYAPESTVFFYSEKDGREGLVAEAYMLDLSLLTREVPAEYQDCLYHKEYRQYPMQIKRIYWKAFVEKKHLFQLPSVNEYGKKDLVKYDYLYMVTDLDSEVDFIKRNVWRYNELSRDGEITDTYYRLWIHQLREKWIRTKIRRPVAAKKCSLCKMQYVPGENVYSDFFELHETYEIDFNEKYRKIIKGNFIVLCPNCHKMEHDKMIC